MTNKQRITIYNVLYFLAFAFAMVFLIWKCKYGFGNIDESFYITIPYRLVQGDSLFLNEWHLSQTSSIFLIPLVKLQLLLFGNMDGVILHFRYAFTIVWGVASLFIFIRLKKYSRIGSAVSSIVFLLYAPFSIMALCYNSMGILFLLIALVIPTTADKWLIGQYIFSGIFFAASVLCCPYLVALYLMFSLFVLVVAIIDYKMKQNKWIAIKRYWLFGTTGIIFLALLFIIYVFNKITVKQLFDVIPYILNDPEHPKVSFIHKTRLFYNSIWFLNRYVYILSAPLFLISFIKKKSKLTLICMFLITYCFIIQTCLNNMYINHVMFPINLLGLFCAINSKEKRVKTMFYGIYIPGIVYAFCLNYSSNVTLYAIFSASTVSTIASCIIISIFTKEVFNNKKYHINKLAIVLLTLLFFIQITTEAYLRQYNVFWDSHINELTEKIEKGPEKGILTTKEKSNYYSVLLEDINEIKENYVGKKALFFSPNTWLYLCFENEFATYSAWLSGTDETTIQRLKAYYKQCENKKPEIIFMEASEFKYGIQFIKMGYTPNKTLNGNYIFTKKR